MRILVVIFSGLFIFSTSVASDGSDPMSLKLGDLLGVYRGITPTDESAIGVGEIEIIISEESILFKVATGNEVTQERISLDQFVEMSELEISEVYRSPEYIQRSFGFKALSGSPKLLFLKDPSTSRLFPARSEYGLIVTGGLSDLLGPTLLLTPQQQMKVSCERLLRSTEFWSGTKGKRVIPRISNGGRAM